MIEDMDTLSSPKNRLIRRYWLYALKLEEDKYYIGITSQSDPQERIKQHMNGFYSAQWVKRYQPTGEVAEIINLGHVTKEQAEKQENKRTLQYMKKYGTQNVRGGKFNYSGNYVRVFNNYFRDEDWESICFAMFMMLVVLILGLTLMYYKVKYHITE